MPPNLKDRTYQDIPQQIGHRQTISQPTTVMLMTQALHVASGQKILEIGTGTGYQAAILARIVESKGKIITTEIIPELVKLAKKNLNKARIKNVKVIYCDGSKGYAKASPYDRIIATAACPDIPKPLIKQLKPNGILLAPVGPLHGQSMLQVTKLDKKNKTKIENLGGFIFVPLRGEHGYK